MSKMQWVTGGYAIKGILTISFFFLFLSNFWSITIECNNNVLFGFFGFFWVFAQFNDLNEVAVSGEFWLMMYRAVHWLLYKREVFTS